MHHTHPHRTAPTIPFTAQGPGHLGPRATATVPWLTSTLPFGLVIPGTTRIAHRRRAR